MRIALIHDYLTQDGGAERVLAVLHEIWPEAPIFVLFHDQNKINYFNNKNIRESFLGRLPLINKYYTWYLPFMPTATESHDLRGFDVVLSSSSTFAKGIITSPGTIHLSYCHTPARYLWSDNGTYINSLKIPQFVKLFLPGVLHRLRIWDKLTVDRVDHFIANSQTVAERIKKYYHRDSVVITPPISTDKYKVSEKIGDYFIAGGRLVPYKRFDILVAVFNRLGWPLKIFGVGPELKRLKKFARANIEFLGHISEEQKLKLLSEAKAFLHPQLEDFGLIPIEAMASGRPVIAYGRGGATETVRANETGVFFDEQTWESLYDTLQKFDATAWDSATIVRHAEQFDKKYFMEKIQDFVREKHEASLEK